MFSQRSWVLLNFACIYIIWGSTYLAIKYALVSFPPFLLAALRFALASGILFILSRSLKESSLNRKEFYIALVSGVLLIVANALICFAELQLSSGLVALLIGFSPIVMMLMHWSVAQGPRPQLHQLVGIGISLVGLGRLTKDQWGGVDSMLSWMSLLACMILWSMGALLQKVRGAHHSLMNVSAVQMGAGAVVSLFLSVVLRESDQFHWQEVQLSAVNALLYLVVFGSVCTFTSYLWLIRHVSPTLVSTNTLVNPVVAVFLGWFLAEEVVTSATVFNSVIVLLGLSVFLWKRSK